MKKIILVAAMLLISMSAFAQPEFGIKAGLNLADITKTDDSKMKPSFYAGISVEFNINRFLAIQPELVYSRQGTFFKEGDEKQWSRFNYINLPIMFKFHVIKGLSFNVGPQFGYMLNAKVKIKSGGVTETESVDGLKDFDVSIGIGAAYKVTEHIEVSGRYNIGLTKLAKEISSAKNGVIQIGAAYIF